MKNLHVNMGTINAMREDASLVRALADSLTDDPAKRAELIEEIEGIVELPDLADEEALAASIAA